MFVNVHYIRASMYTYIYTHVSVAKRITFGMPLILFVLELNCLFIPLSIQWQHEGALHKSFSLLSNEFLFGVLFFSAAERDAFRHGTDLPLASYEVCICVCIFIYIYIYKYMTYMYMHMMLIHMYICI